MGAPRFGREGLIESLRHVTAEHGAVVLGAHGMGVTTVLRAAADAVRSSGSAVRFVRPSLAGVEVLTGEPSDLIVVDDAHRLGERDLTRLVEVALTRPVLVGARSGAASEDLAWLWRSGAIERFELDALDTDQVLGVLEHRAGGPIHRGLAELIAFRSGGRPGFVADDIDSLIASGGLRQVGGLRRATPTATVGRRLVERARDVLGDLPPDCAADASLLAVAGHLPHHVLADLGVDASELARRSLIVEDERVAGPVIRLDPPVLAAAIRAGLSAAHERQLALRVPTQVRERHLDPFDSVRIAMLVGEPTDIEALIAASRAALRRQEPSLALWLAREASKRSPLGAMAEAEMLMEVGHRAGAAETFAALLANDEADPLLRARAAVEYSLLLLWDLGRPEQAMQVADRLAAQSAGGPFEALARTHRAAVTMYGGHPGEALAALDHVDTDALHRLGRESVEMIRVASRALVDPAALPEEFGAVLAVIDVDDGAAGLEPAITMISVALALELAGHVDRASDMLVAWRSKVIDRSTPAGFAWLALAGARIELAAGRPESARLAAAEAWDGFAATNHPSGLRWAAGALLLADALQGDREACRRRLSEFTALEPGVPFLDADLLRARAWGLWATGDTAVAVAAMGEAVESARAARAVALEAVALHDTFRLFRNTTGTRLSELARQSPAPAIVLRARHLELVRAADAQRLVSLAEEFERHGALLIGAEVAADARAIAKASGMRSTERVALGLQVRLVEECGSVSSPALSEHRAAALTARERDVAMLAADGLSSREIGQRLQVSVRTVDNLLQRVYAKLGISGRTELVGRRW